MSISNQTDKIFGTGDGVTLIFSFPFKIFSPTDLVVYEIDTTQTPNVSYQKVYQTDYTVVINTSGEGGTLTFTVAPPLNWQTLIQRVEPFTQSLELNTEGNLPAQQIENQLDLMTMLCIQVNEAVSRCPQLPVTYNGTLPLLMPAPQANLVIGWDPTGTFLVNLMATAAGTIAVPISNANLQALIAANLVNGSSLYGLGNIVAGAGIIPVAHLPVGTTANKVLQLNGSAQIPAVDGSQLSNLPNQRITTQSNPTRVAGTVYTNATGKPIVVAVSVAINESSQFSACSDNTGMPSLVVGIFSNSINEFNEGTITFIVLPGNNYSVTVTAGSGSIGQWIEWN